MLWELVDLSDWKKKSQVLKELEQGGIKIDERRFRKLVELQNNLYCEHESEKFIVHGPKGYKVTTDREEILKSVADNHKRAINLLYKESKTKKALGENMNFNLVINNDEFMYMEA